VLIWLDLKRRFDLSKKTDHVIFQTKIFKSFFSTNSKKKFIKFEIMVNDEPRALEIQSLHY
jgi:hypothetical protein